MANLEVKDLKLNNENLKSVFGEMMHLKGILKRLQSEAQSDKLQYEHTIDQLRNDITDLQATKIEYIKGTMNEMNSLRDIIKALQKRYVSLSKR